MLNFSVLFNQIKKNVGEAPIIELLNQLIRFAVEANASDIHLEPFEDFLRVRTRLDGVLQLTAELPESITLAVVSRLKIMASLDIAERRLPQDGRVKLNERDHGRALDCRVSTCPTLFGEKIVLRLLHSTLNHLALHELGFDPELLVRIKQVLNQSQGIILVTGPTGSGKTSTLYSTLEHLNVVERNICTVEDPVEIQMPGINQVPIQPKIGFGFPKALRAFLRQDPDVMMIGEIRDAETGEIAVKAAQTGHLVLSTLHTNSATEALVRLTHMGILPYQIASSLHLVIAQRLLRTLCLSCRKTDEVGTDLLKKQGLLKDTEVLKAVGCSLCHQGYKGRIAVFEAFFVDEKIQQLIIDQASSLALKSAALQQGMQLLRAAGLAKVLAQHTSLAELERVL